jgi:hypothetical protein
MPTPSQIAANQKNAEKSTGPQTDAGKAAISMNAFMHGLTGRFVILPSEDPSLFDKLATALELEHNPMTPTETILVERMAQHHWLAQRAMSLQQLCFDGETGICTEEKQLAVYVRYQTTHERAFHKCLSDLLKIRAELRRAENGFVSQKQKVAAEARAIELHEARVRLANARAQTLEIDSDIRQTINAPLPRHTRVPFEDMCDAFKVVMQQFNREFHAEIEAKAAQQDKKAA